MKKVYDIINTIRDSDLTTKVYIYMSTKVAGDDYDGYEANYTYSNLNPIIIKAYVRQLTAESLVYKQYGLHQVGAVEIICEKKYRSCFEKCNKVVIDDVTYQVFKEGTGNRNLILDRPYNLLKVVLSRNG